MLIQAKFKGVDGSLGYKKKSIYHLTMTIVNGEIWIHPRSEYLEAQPCNYGSLKLFLANWTVL